MEHQRMKCAQRKDRKLPCSSPQSGLQPPVAAAPSTSKIRVIDAKELRTGTYHSSHEQQKTKQRHVNGTGVKRSPVFDAT